MDNNLGQLIRHSTAWIAGGNASLRMLRFAVSIALARILVPEDFGLIATVSVFTGVAGMVAGGGMGDALVRAKTISDEDRRVIFTMQALICVSIYTFFYWLAVPFADWFNDPRYTDLMRVSALNFLLRPFENVPRASLRREMRFRAITLIQFAGIITSSAASIALALQGLGPWSLILGGLAGSVATIVALFLITRWIPGIRFVLQTARTLGAYGFKQSVNNILTYFRNELPVLLISRSLGPASVGLYNRGAGLVTMPMATIAGSTYQPVFRALASVQDNLDRSRYIFLRMITLVCVYVFPFYAGIALIAEPLIVFVYGVKWAAAAEPARILALAGFFRAVSNASGAVAAAQNRLGYEARIQTEGLVLLVAGILAGLRWGLPGVAWGVLPSQIYMAWRMYGLAGRCVRTRRGDLGRALAPALVLNAILLAMFALVHSLLPAGLDADAPGLYLAAAGGACALAYTIAFLALPIPALATEATRWRTLLRLPGTSPATRDDRG